MAEGFVENGATVYDNRAVLFARAKWGKITYQEDFEDTHKSVAFEQYRDGPFTTVPSVRV